MSLQAVELGGDVDRSHYRGWGWGWDGDPSVSLLTHPPLPSCMWTHPRVLAGLKVLPADGRLGEVDLVEGEVGLANRIISAEAVVVYDLEVQRLLQQLVVRPACGTHMSQPFSAEVDSLSQPFSAVVDSLSPALQC